MKGAIDLAESERGVFCIALVLASLALAVLGKLTGAEWIAFAQWIAITLVASKTITGAVETIRGATLPEARVVSEKPSGEHIGA